MINKKTFAKTTALLLLLMALLFAGGRLLPHEELRSQFPYSRAVYDEQGNLLRLTTASDEKYRLWTDLAEFNPQLIEAVLLQEDEWFYWHFGVNPYGLLRGAWQSYVLRNAPQGGSTISMQLARLRWHIDSRSIWGKIQQIGRAIQLEIQYSKAEILEAYLNFAPYGRNIEGAGTASLIYFDKANRQLNLAENLTLAILPKNPSVYIRQQNQQLNSALLQARNQLYQRWLKQHPEDQKWQADFQLNYALRTPEKLPFFAPHFVDQLLQQYPDSQIHSSLNSTLQQLVERISQRYLAQQKSKGVNNLAVILLDNRTLQVKALIGSGDYFNAQIAGQVNGAMAKRSYGSTLKPFVYALAFEQGLALPQSILRDLPSNFNNYQPENYEGNFLGPISITQALLKSRNIPGIDMAQQLKQRDLYDFLQQAHIQLPKAKSHYGLSLVLGGAELSPQQLVGLYAMLANQGIWQAVQWRKDQIPSTQERLLSAESSFMISQILRQNPRPDMENKAIKTRLPIYWKTGTSNGLRDAWTAGYFGNYSLVVWFGHFNNRSNPHFIGRQLATPLFLQLADAIIQQSPQMSDIKGAEGLNLIELEVCSADGNLPNQYCQQRSKSLFIPGISPIKVSQIHQPFVVEKGSDRLACPPYQDQLVETKIYEIWPNDLQAIFRQAGLYKRQPESNPNCPYVQQNQDISQYEQRPIISSPISQREYVIQTGGKTQIPLSARTQGNVQQLFWFVDSSFIGQVPAQQSLLWQPKRAGSYVISVVDDQGRDASMNLNIRIHP